MCVGVGGDMCVGVGVTGCGCVNECVNPPLFMQMLVKGVYAEGKNLWHILRCY